MLLLPVAHLFLVSVLVWIAGRVKFRGGMLIQGLKLGVVSWCAGQAPLWLLWYAEQPWPGELVIEQLVLELISSMVLGVTISAVVSQRQAGPSAASAV